MPKFHELLPKRQDLSDAEFHDHWRYVHAPYADRVSGVAKYVQSHREPVSAAPFESPYHGVAEAWFGSVEAALALGEDPAYTEGAQKDEPNFLATDQMQFLVTEDRGTAAGTGRPDRTDRVKLLLFLRRSADISRDEFERKRPSAEALAGVGDVEQVVQSCSLSLPEPVGEQLFDGVDEIFFPDAETASTRAAAIAELAGADGAVDIPASVAMVVRQLRIF